MQTRSQTRLSVGHMPMYTVEIDFDGASEAWKANKIPKGNGTYAYRCTKTLKTGENCSQKCCGTNDYCKRHLQK